MHTQAEREHTINGIAGRYLGATVGGAGYRAGTFTFQRWVSSKPIDYHGERAKMTVTLRFDDDCRNGHNTFSATADVQSLNRRRADRDLAGGCLHDEIAKHFPSLAPLLKWHLTSADGPMHYEANAVYLAGDRDHWGLRAGEPHHFDHFIRFGTSPIAHKVGEKLRAWLTEPGRELHDLEVIRVDHPREPQTYGPKFTFGGYDQPWHSCPFDTEREALEWSEALKGPHTFTREPTSWGEGKPRDLAGARSAAIWPEATDEELSAEPEALREALRARLPKLLDEFRAAMVEECGFAWSP